MKKIISITLIVVLAISLVACGKPTNTDGTINNEDIPAEEKNSPKISKEEFDALETGMTYEEVVSIIGGEGEIASQVDVAGYETKMYIWQGEGTIGANANAMFQNNSLTSKAQFGLE